MKLLFGVIAVFGIILFVLGLLVVYFSDEVVAYIQTKTDELHAMTDLIKRTKQKGDTHRDA